MGTATATPEARAVTEKLCREFGLRLETKGLQRLRDWTGSKKSADEKEAGLVAAIEAMEPGAYLVVEHPGLDTEEMRAMGHKGYENVAADRVELKYRFAFGKRQETKTVEMVRIGGAWKSGQTRAWEPGWDKGSEPEPQS